MPTTVTLDDASPIVALQCIDNGSRSEVRIGFFSEAEADAFLAAWAGPWQVARDLDADLRLATYGTCGVPDRANLRLCCPGGQIARTVYARLNVDR